MNISLKNEVDKLRHISTLHFGLMQQVEKMHD